MINWSYTINDESHPMNGKTLWSGRYCAVVGFVIIHKTDDNNFYILANKRGDGTPDYQGYWNCPCGFLEADESAEQGVAREILEETGFNIEPAILKFLGVETDPEKSNNGNVSLRYYTIIESDNLPKLKYENINGELDEVSDVKWINIDNINEYQWAFHHETIINSIKDNLLINKCYE